MKHKPSFCENKSKKDVSEKLSNCEISVSKNSDVLVVGATLK
jgi:hypothetical protein